LCQEAPCARKEHLVAPGFLLAFRPLDVLLLGVTVDSVARGRFSEEYPVPLQVILHIHLRVKQLVFFGACEELVCKHGVHMWT